MGNLKKHIKIAKRNTKITPKLHAWLNNNDGIHVTTPSTWEKVIAILRPSEGDRSGAFHPSQLYNCPRAQIFDYYGLEGQAEYNPTLQNLFNDGHYRHLRWQIMLLEAEIIDDVEVKISIPEYRLVGSMDGINTKEGWMFELKGTSQFSQVTKKGAMPAHIKQVNAYLMASGLDSALVVYECKSSQQWVEIEVDKDQMIVDEITEILQELNDSIDTGRMPEILHDCKNKEGTEYNRCKHKDVCFRVKTTGDIENFQVESGVAIT